MSSFCLLMKHHLIMSGHFCQNHDSKTTLRLSIHPVLCMCSNLLQSLEYASPSHHNNRPIHTISGIMSKFSWPLSWHNEYLNIVAGLIYKDSLSLSKLNWAYHAKRHTLPMRSTQRHETRQPCQSNALMRLVLSDTRLLPGLHQGDLSYTIFLAGHIRMVLL